MPFVHYTSRFTLNLTADGPSLFALLSEWEILTPRKRKMRWIAPQLWGISGKLSRMRILGSFGICLIVFQLTSASTWALCGVPRSRLVCAEAANSGAVVVARIESRRAIPASGQDDDGYVYRLRRVELLRGEISKSFKLVSYNNSGRPDFDLKVGQSYLLFVHHAPSGKAWFIESCANSGPLGKAGPVIKKVKAMSRRHTAPRVSGVVSTEAWSTGVSGVRVRVSGQNGTFAATTDEDGNFKLEVPPGDYTATANLNGWTFAVGMLSREDPDQLHLDLGACSQIHFEGRANP